VAPEAAGFGGARSMAGAVGNSSRRINERAVRSNRVNGDVHDKIAVTTSKDTLAGRAKLVPASVIKVEADSAKR
jgi:hypothetical protein